MMSNISNFSIYYSEEPWHSIAYIVISFSTFYLHVIHSTKQRHHMYLYNLTHLDICIIKYHHGNNHDLMVVFICFVVIADSLDSRKDNCTGSDENSMPCVNDDCGKSFVIYLNYKNTYHREETKKCW